MGGLVTSRRTGTKPITARKLGDDFDRAAALQAELDKSQAATVNAEKFMGIVRKHLAFEELTPTLLREMIEKIVVHECSYDENGTRRQDIEIYYSFVGKIDLPE